MTIYIIIFFVFFLIFLIFLFLLKLKIDFLEKKIISKFSEKNNQIPSIFDITKKYLNKHDEIFKEILKLRKNEFLQNYNNFWLKENIYIYTLIHNELNFIFRVCLKHNKLNKDNKYLFIRDNLIEINSDIEINLKLYKNIIKKFNKLIFIKNIFIIWLFVPIEKKYI